jgi:pimeloyl-ACP methyl ester carboxylesterase
LIGEKPQKVTVSTEELLVPFGSNLYAMHVRLFEPAVRRGTVFCFHGFAGNGIDFGTLGPVLAQNGYLVVCPDMPGRGRSAHLADARSYDLRRIVKAAAAALAKYGTDRPAIIGMGWGGLIAMLAADLSVTRATRIVITDLPLDFSVEGDAVIARALADAELSFATEQEALAHVAAGPEFAGQPDIDIRHRIESGYRLAFDARIPLGTRRYGGRQYDLRALCGDRDAELLLMSGRANIGVAEMRAYSASRPGTYVAAGQGEGERALLRTPAEIFTILGFLGSASALQR